MKDVLWSDVSEWQVPVDDSYPFDVLAVRSDDGTYRDRNFAWNYQWGCNAIDSGRLSVLIIYLVYRQNWRDELATIKAMVGPIHPRTAFMIDVESWSGQIKGDQSRDINGLFWELAAWAGEPKRVIGYGNAGDLNTLWPVKPPGARIILANYSANPDYPGKLGHQFTNGKTLDHLLVPPFGYADVNSADGYDLAAFCAALGIKEDDMDANQARQLTEIHDRLLTPITTRAGNPKEDPANPYKDDVVGFAANTDGYGWRAEQQFFPAIATRLDNIEATLSKLLSVLSTPPK